MRPVFLAAIAASVAGAQTPPAVARIADATSHVFSGTAAKATVAFMDKFVRWPGNTGFDTSVHRVERLLKEAGYVPQMGAPADARFTYRIEIVGPAPTAWDPIDASVTIVGERAALLSFATNRNMLATNSASTADTGVVAEVVDVGKGAAADFDRAPVSGKIVLMDGSIGAAYRAASQRGALGALSYGLAAYTQPETHRNSIQFGSIPAGSKSWGVALSMNAVTRLREAIARGPVRVRVVSKARTFASSNIMLVAEIRGSATPEDRFVLSAHVQEPGANDNASGVGALAEMARAMASLIKEKKVDPKRTITMLFGNEIEQTRRYLTADTSRARRVLWGLSMDMVGEDTKQTGGTFLIEKMPDPSAVWTRGEDKHSEWGGRPLSKDRIRPHYYNDFLLARCQDRAAKTGWVVKTNPFEGGSDHTPFIDAGRPGVLFWHFTDVYYHTDGDRLDKVSEETLANVGNCAMTSVLTLTSADGETARGLVAEIEGAARKRLSAELALSRAAIASGGDRAKENDILETWRDYYVKAIGAMRDIEVGGSSPETQRAIEAAAARVGAVDITLK